MSANNKYLTIKTGPKQKPIAKSIKTQFPNPKLALKK